MAFLKNSIKNSTAQATVEYLLLIVVVIALATGIGGPLGIYLKKFSGALLGPQGYYACLTEQGLLPGDPQVPSQCSRQAQLAMGALNQIQTGSGFDGGSGGGSVNNRGGNSGNNNNWNNPADNNWNNNDDSNDSDNDSDNASSSGNEDSNENRFKNSKSSKDKNQNASRHKAGLSGQEGEGSLSGSGGGAFSGDSSNSPSSFLAGNSFSSGKGKKKKKKRRRSFSGGRGLGSEGEGGAFDSKSQGYKRLRFRAQTAQGYLGEAYLSEEEAEQDKPVFKEAQISGGSGGSFAGDTKKNPLIPDRKPNQKKDLDTKVKGMNFSAFLKYFVIIALILVVLVVIFSQVMEYQSRE